MIDDCGAITGCPTSAGRLEVSSGSFSDIVWRATRTSVSQSNSAQTMERPSVEVLLIRLIPLAPESDDSIGYDTKASTSSVFIAPHSVITTTVGAFKSGKISISASCAE